MPKSTPQTDPDRADEQPAKAPTAKQLSAQRVTGARFIGGVWRAEDGSPLTDVETQQAHRAADKAAAEARAKAVRGEA